jgi:hypothetical protein
MLALRLAEPPRLVKRLWLSISVAHGASLRGIALYTGTPSRSVLWGGIGA